MIIAGGSGFLGQALARYFSEREWEIVILTRSPRENSGLVKEVYWDGRNLGAWRRELEGAKALVNLTGKSVNCRYHARNRREILDSRLESTRVLGAAVRGCDRPPGVWLNSSTATIYRHTYGAAWDEGGAIGAVPEAKDAFSIEVATAWERVFEEVEVADTRKVLLRTAMVLGGGRNSVFPVLHRLVRAGLGGSMGDGRQYVSWIHEVDFQRAVEWLIERDEIRGVANVASPQPLTNAAMMKTLRSICGVPIGFSASAWMLELGAFLLRTETELIIKSRRVIPRRLLESGFRFQFPMMEGAFQNLVHEHN